MSDEKHYNEKFFLFESYKSVNTNNEIHLQIYKFAHLLYLNVKTIIPYPFSFLSISND